jgi:acyl-CoA dehydrogenase
MSALTIERPEYMRQDDVVILERSIGKFLDGRVPETLAVKWREDGMVERAMWREAGEAGLLCLGLPRVYGGGGGDFRHETVLNEQLARRGLGGFAVALHNTIVAPYVFHYGSEEQKARWLPMMASGAFVGAIAMTESGTGSDLQAVRTVARKEGNHYVLSGQKTFISNGQSADLIVVVAKTDPALGAKGISLIVVETAEAEGFRRGRNLDKLGFEMQDTSELFFDDVRVPTANLLGPVEGQGFAQLMQQLPQERLTIAVGGVATMERALDETIAYVKERKAFGQRLIDFQNTQFKLAECKTEAQIARVFVDRLIGLHLEGKLDAAAASMAKYWVTDLENKVVDACLQMFGGYGYMSEFPIARMYRDSRVQRIYGGANEIMKALIARTL